VTHDELLSYIRQNCIGMWEYRALEAVLVRHTPVKSKLTGANICAECSRNDSIGTAYPCPTVKDIEKELK